MNLNPALLDAIRKDLAPALAEVAKRNGLAELKLGKITYDPAAGTFGGKLSGIIDGGMTEDAARYERTRKGWGCKHYPELGTAMPGGRPMKITGMTRGGKITLVDPAGKAWTIGHAAFERAFPMPKADADKLFGNARVTPDE